MTNNNLLFGKIGVTGFDERNIFDTFAADATCAHCERGLSGAWNYCPHCGQPSTGQPVRAHAPLTLGDEPQPVSVRFVGGKEPLTL